jgi:hypothetical protein
MSTRSSKSMPDLRVTVEFCKYLVATIVDTTYDKYQRNTAIYELLNCVEWFCLSNANSSSIGKIYHSLNNSPRVAKLLSMLKENVWLSRGAGNLTEKHIEAVLTGLINGDTVAAEKPVSITAGTLQFDGLSIPLTERIVRLVKLGGKERAASVVARYASAIGGGQQWGIPFPHYKFIGDHLGKPVCEAFASPLNSRAIEFGGKFCSLFPDTDTIYGSLGSVFNVNLSDHSSVWTANPPFVEDIMEKFADHLLACFESSGNRPLTVFALLPSWNDAKGYTKLKASKYCLEDRVLEKGRFYLEAPNRDCIISHSNHHYLIMHKAVETSKEWLTKLKGVTAHIQTLQLPSRTPGAYGKRYVTEHLITSIGALHF